MTEEKKNETISAIITLVVMILLIILLALLGLTYQYPPPAPREVILIEMTPMNGGGGGGGGGNTQTQPRTQSPSVAENVTIIPSVSLPSVTPPRNVQTSTDGVETSIVTAPAQPDPVPNQAATFRPGMGGGSGGGSGTGSGTGLGSGLGPGQGSGSGGGSGSGTGTGTGGGIGYGTGGRGHLFMPDLTVNEQGQVYVEVHVGEDGLVKNARVISTPKYPTTITNARIQQECVRKAYTAKYKPGKEELRIIVFK